jgi:PEP-CTERM motif
MVRSRVRFVLLGCAALALALSTSGAVHAFYWVDWPGSGSPSTSTTSTQAVTTTGTSTGGTVSVTGDPSSPSSFVPEPASLIVGLVGLGSVGLVRRFRQK